MNIEKRRTIMKSFVTSQSSYCPLIWMFRNRRLNNKIDSIHERALSITYQIIRQHFKNCQTTTTLFQRITETCKFRQQKCLKFYRGLSPEILRELFLSKTSSYNLRRNHTFEKRNVHSVYYGTESLSFLDPKIWDLVPV